MVSLRTVPDNIKAPWAASYKPSLEAAALVRFRPRPGKSRPPQKPAETRTSTPGGNATARVQPGKGVGHARGQVALKSVLTSWGQ